MGSSLSRDEEKDLIAQLSGIQPASMAAIVWDTINNVGLDDEQDKFGISFEGDKETSKVTFWDKGDATEMPKKVFLGILETMCNSIIKVYETDYNLERSPELKTGVDKLRMAQGHLRKEIATLPVQEGVLDYRKRLDNLASADNVATAAEMVAETRQRRGSMSWSNANPLISTNRGLEAVIDRLPELRRRYETATRKTKPMLKVRKKIMALGIFGSKIHHEESDNGGEKGEGENVQLPPENYTRQRRHTLVVPTETQLSLARLARPDSSSSVTSNELKASTAMYPMNRRGSVGDIP